MTLALLMMRVTNILRWLLVLAIGLPMLALLLQFARVLLVEMGDPRGGEVLRGISVGVGITWAATLLGLLIVVAVETISRDEPRDGP
jgi:hypothetical protein